jgi:hypothetical protein
MRIVLDGQMHRADPEVINTYRAGDLLSGPIAQSAAGSKRVLVNLFNGGPRSKVAMTIGRSETATPMTRVIRHDPFVDEVYARNIATKKPWVNAGPSTHLWQATLPADLPTGAHRIAINAVDEYGEEHASWMILEVTG